MNHYLRLAGFSLALLLTGCAGTNADFECNATTSDSCMTMEEANQKAKSVTDTSKVGPAVGVSQGQGNTTLPQVAPLSEAVSGPEDARNVVLSDSLNTSPSAAEAQDNRPLLTLASCTVTTCPQVKKVTAHRLSEGVAQLWVAPYIDADDVLHQPGKVHFIVKPGHWQQIQSL